jgi:nitrate reductase NapE component
MNIIQELLLVIAFAVTIVAAFAFMEWFFDKFGPNGGS